MLGPVLFSLYTSPLRHIIEMYNIQHHRYADDLQLYTVFDPKDDASVANAIDRLQSCIKHISVWMSHHSLKLNHDKTELVNILSPYHYRKFGVHSIVVEGIVINPKPSVKSLGVVIDRHLSMSDHVSSIVQSCNFSLRNISKIRPFITDDACKSIVQNTIISRIDYCSSLLFGVCASQIMRLQRIQNRAARMITRSSVSSHITPILYNLHWLPCSFRIQFRILTFVFKCLNDLAPSYFRSLISLFRPARHLRSSNDDTILQTSITKKSVGQQGFSFVGSLWNKLPTAIRMSPSISSFKRRLKTYFFTKHYVP